MEMEGLRRPATKGRLQMAFPGLEFKRTCYLLWWGLGNVDGCELVKGTLP